MPHTSRCVVFVNAMRNLRTDQQSILISVCTLEQLILNLATIFFGLASFIWYASVSLYLLHVDMRIFFIKFPFKHPPKTTEKNTEIKKTLRINWIIKHFPRYMQTLNFSRFMTFESHLPEMIERLSGVQMMNRVTEMSGIIFMLPKILFSVRLIRLPLLISF